MVRMMTFPDALARRVHTNGAAAARLAPATPAVATNVRRDILLGCVSVRSFMALPPATGGCLARSTYRTGRVVGIVGGTSLVACRRFRCQAEPRVSIQS